jgi:hypothetical protein
MAVSLSTRAVCFNWIPITTNRKCGWHAELAPDGKPVFKGPRVAMAVHQSCEFTVVR